MKNFSVKTADFDSLSISGEAPIVQSDLGTAPNQIPLNKDLGSLAYMNAPQIKDLNVDTLELREIAAELSETAVDVFVYDTRRDSDGGAWRGRTQHTSWYNEELNTATRGSRREFPAVAVIVAEANKVTIYDGDDPDLNMWMVFEQEGSTAGTANLIGPTQASLTSVFMLNGIISITENTWSVGLITANFISEGFIHYWETPKNYNGSISQRNDSMGYSAGDNEIIVNPYGNDVAMTVLPNAPIDADTGLPIPTIAVATDGGVSVIKDDGSVVDKGTTGAAVNQVQWMGSGRLVATAPLYYVVFDDPFVEESDTFLAYISDASYHANPDHNDLYQVPNLMAQLDANSKLLTLETRTIIASTSAGLNVHEMGEGAAANNNHGIATYITSKYNTGWMPGDIKLAALSDTKNETVGVDESAELVTNGHFTTDTTGWSSLRVDLSTEDVKLKITINDGASDNGSAYQDLNLIGGKKYTVSGYIENGTADNVDVLIHNGSNFISESIAITSGSLDFTFDFIADYNLNRLMVRVQESAVGQYAYADGISVKQTGELITNGTFDDGTTGWADNNSTLEIDSSTGDSRLKITDNGASAGAYQLIKTVAGKKYTVTAIATSLDLADGRFEARDQSFTGTILNSIDPIGLVEDEVLTFNFIAASNDTVIILGGGSNTGHVAYFDNISVRLAEPDRSVNDNGLQIFGEIDKTPVAPGADLVAYSGFSADDYLMQTYNSDLDFGTGDFCVMGWFKNANVNALLCTRLLPQLYNTSGTDRGFLISFGSNGVLSFATYTEGFQATGRKSVGSQNDMSGIDGWTHFVAVRDGGVMKLYINAIKEISETANSDDISDDTTSIPLSIGCFNELSANRFTGSTALIRISATVPTAEQIAKIYHDEKVLFQDGAQATLYGTSDAVTALAYDDKTELLHVGTSDGRSDFAGLRRINNTTTAVTTSISASNNLIAEQ